MIKLTAEQAVFYLSLLSSRQVICVRTRAGPLGPLWGCAVGRVHQMLSLFSSLHIINPVSSPGMVYWQVQGWAPIFNTKSWTEVPGCWLGWFNTFSPSRQHKHTCFACRIMFYGLSLSWPDDVQAHKDKWKLILAKPSLWTGSRCILIKPEIPVSISLCHSGSHWFWKLFLPYLFLPHCSPAALWCRALSPPCPRGFASCSLPVTPTPHPQPRPPGAPLTLKRAQGSQLHWAKNVSINGVRGCARIPSRSKSHSNNGPVVLTMHSQTVLITFLAQYAINFTPF